MKAIKTKNKQRVLILFILIITSSLSINAQTLLDLVTSPSSDIGNFGNQIDISNDGQRFIMGDSTGGTDTDGRAIVYERNGNEWEQIGNMILPENSFDGCGSSVSISGDGQRISVGSILNDNDNGNNVGHVRVFELQGNTWIQIGEDIDGEASNNLFGKSSTLSLTGNRIIIGGYLNSNDNGNNSGHARVFELQGSSWIQLGDDIDGEFSNDYFGWLTDISQDGNIVAVGAPRNSQNGFEAGHIRVFQFINNQWEQLGQDIDGEEYDSSAVLSDYMDMQLSNDGLTLVVGSPGHRVNDESQVGKVKVYEFLNDEWTQKGQNIIGLGEFDSLGQSVSISGDSNIISIASKANSSTNNGFVEFYIYNELNSMWESFGSPVTGDGSDVRISLSNDANYLISTNTDDEIRVFSLSSLLGIDAAFNLSHVSIYPNPSDGKVFIESNNEIQSVQLISIRGEIIKEFYTNSINLNSMKSGIYVLKITDIYGNISFTKLIKK